MCRHNRAAWASEGVLSLSTYNYSCVLSHLSGSSSLQSPLAQCPPPSHHTSPPMAQNSPRSHKNPLYLIPHTPPSHHNPTSHNISSHSLNLCQLLLLILHATTSPSFNAALLPPSLPAGPCHTVRPPLPPQGGSHYVGCCSLHSSPQ